MNLRSVFKLLRLRKNLVNYSSKLLNLHAKYLVNPMSVLLSVPKRIKRLMNDYLMNPLCEILSSLLSLFGKAFFIQITVIKIDNELGYIL